MTEDRELDFDSETGPEDAVLVQIPGVKDSVYIDFAEYVDENPRVLIYNETGDVDVQEVWGEEKMVAVPIDSDGDGEA